MIEVLALATMLEHPIDRRAQEFSERGSAGAAYLRATAFDPRANLQARWRAITTMGRMSQNTFRRELDRALSAREWFLRNAALIALQTGDRSRAVSWSQKLLSDPALIVRTQAVRNLIALDARECERELWKALYDRENFKGDASLWVRAHIAEALSRFAGPGRTARFHRMLMDTDSRLHRWAVEGLEASTGMRLTNSREPVTVRREQWLARLGDHAT